MKVMQSFLMFFYILDQCYDICSEYDLGGFLGAISPELWEDGIPIDKAIVKDWQEFSKPETIDKYNIIRKTYDFLNFYEEKFGLKFSKTKQLLITSKDQNIVENAITKTRQMYQRFDYIN